MARRTPIHPSIKSRLGYAVDEPDKQVLSDWRDRLKRVCKPCWELKYCPYGPFVEQSPILPPLRSEIEAHDDYKRRCLEIGRIGSSDPITENERSFYETAIDDEEYLIRRAAFEIQQQELIARALKSDEPLKTFRDNFGAPLPPIHIYRVAFEADPNRCPDIDDFEPQYRERILAEMEHERERVRSALSTGIYDGTREMDSIRRAMFEEELAESAEDKYPTEIPEIFSDASCNIFGHICPVFFAAESITETQEKRRRGRYISFATKMRVVRRDNHTCQHCTKHLRDDEVEFDHIIPISKGGSSEEHNIRLTCFSCNREKSAKIQI